MLVLKLSNISEAELWNAFPKGSKNSNVLRSLLPPHTPLTHSPGPQAELRHYNLLLPDENRTLPNKSFHKNPL